MSRDNIGWGAPRIHGELQMLGIQVSESTVGKYMIRHRRPPSQTRRTFLDNHVSDLVSVDFFTVPTVAFRKLQLIDDATCDLDLRSPPSNHFEKLRGKLASKHSIRINKHWRLVFAWSGERGDAKDIYLDNHDYR